MSNPFKYGVVVWGNDFADREKELKELVGKLKENVRIFLVAPTFVALLNLLLSITN